MFEYKSGTERFRTRLLPAGRMDPPLLLSLLLLLQLAAQPSDELQETEPLRGLVRLALRNGQGFAHRVHESEGTAQASGVALPPIDGIETELGHLPLLIEVHVVGLGRVGDLLPRWLGPHEGAGVDRLKSLEEPDAVGLGRVDGEAEELVGQVKPVLDAEPTQSLQVRLLGDGPDDRGDELEVLGEACSPVLGPCSKNPLQNVNLTKLI